jgi:3-hydroxybutyryl-CoA dehydrogenase
VRAVKRGNIDAADRDAALARITMTSDPEDAAGADLVVEAVPENVELKTSIMKTLGGIVGDHAIIARTPRPFRSRNWPVLCTTPTGWLGCISSPPSP